MHVSCWQIFADAFARFGQCNAPDVRSLTMCNHLPYRIVRCVLGDVAPAGCQWWLAIAATGYRSKQHIWSPLRVHAISSADLAVPNTYWMQFDSKLFEILFSVSTLFAKIEFLFLPVSSLSSPLIWLAYQFQSGLHFLSKLPYLNAKGYTVTLLACFATYVISIYSGYSLILITNDDMHDDYGLGGASICIVVWWCTITLNANSLCIQVVRLNLTCARLRICCQT